MRQRALGALMCAVALTSGCAVFDDEASSGDDDSDVAGAIFSGLGVFAQALAETSAPSGRRPTPAYVPPATYVPATPPRPKLQQQAQQLPPAPLQPLPQGKPPAQPPAPSAKPTRVEHKFVAQPPNLSNLPQPILAQQFPPKPSPSPAAQGNVAAPAKLWMPPAPGIQEQTPSSKLNLPTTSPTRTAPTGTGSGPGAGTASTRDDPHRCITAAIDTKSVLGGSCKAFEVYNRCAAPVDIRTCVHLTQANKWSCELKSVQPNARKVHETCSPHRSRFVDVRYSDDYRTRLGMPPSP